MRILLIAGVLLTGCANDKPGTGDGLNPYAAPPPPIAAPPPEKSGGMS